MTTEHSASIRHDWSIEEIEALFAQPFLDLVSHAQQVHRENFTANEVQISTLLSIKTGACPEDCKYCPQSAHYRTDVERERLLAVERVLEEAQAAAAQGASRFCMGAAWRNPKDRDMPYLIEMIQGVKALGLETCMTLGMLSAPQAAALKQAGLDYYNHNLDTSPEFYGDIITTRTYEDRLATLEHVLDAGMKVCAGGIVGMGEARRDRASLLQQLANLPKHPESVPINMLVRVEGTPLAQGEDLDPFEFIRTIAVARIVMPASTVRLSAGRETMDDSTQALCFMAGANSIFYGERLLTTDNPALERDQALFRRLDLQPSQTQGFSDETHAQAIADAITAEQQSTLYYPA
ncbi:biotin synthase BioB [Pseudidiomarina taiwanensis]|uniref:Biotin synthase n=1 Tax=Pseudidiomarina taiwanensis TaxID=337250 RepID=A0A432ZNF8_9GAMM|nr:biotin synthase BioB [Pseudidiomarina taiwanensis]RUO79398.1 biotin synthase BioB [Pseudidiomarina taiwanensis]